MIKTDENGVDCTGLDGDAGRLHAYPLGVWLMFAGLQSERGLVRPGSHWTGSQGPGVW